MGKLETNFKNRFNKWFGDSDIVTCTATTAGATTGTIPSTANVVNAVGVTGHGNYLILLPTPVVGKEVTIVNTSGFPFYLATSNATDIYLNGTKGSTVSLHIDTNKVVRCKCISLTQWLVSLHDCGDTSITTCTATVAGATTGTIPTSATIVNGVGINGQVAYLILLPLPAIGKRIVIINNSGYTFNLATSSAANVELNGAKTAGYKLVVATAKIVVCECVSLTNWVAIISDYTAAS